MTSLTLIHGMFWAGVGILFYTFAGYPFFLLGLGKCFHSRRSCRMEAVESPTITVLLVVGNEEARIASRLTNLLETDYPPDKFEIVVVSDGSTDGTVANLTPFLEERVRLVVNHQRQGKAAGLNLGLEAARGELVVFADARQRFTPETIPNLARHFVNPEVGAVSGALMIDSAASSVGGGVDAYWKLEKFIREQESVFDSSIGCTGAVYSIRRDLFRAIPADTVLDDVVIPMQAAIQGYRVLFDPAAMAFDPQSLEPARESIRKRRTLAGNFQMFFRYPQWLWPWRNRLWWQLISHKYLRLAAPFWMVEVFVVNALLAADPFYGMLFMFQCAFYLLALIGIGFSRLKSRFLTWPAGFVFLNWMVLRGLWHYLTAPRLAGWGTQSQVRDKQM